MRQLINFVPLAPAVHLWDGGILDNPAAELRLVADVQPFDDSAAEGSTGTVAAIVDPVVSPDNL